MQDSDVAAAVLRDVQVRGLLSAPRVPADPVESTAVLEGDVRVEGREVTLQLALDRSFPLSLPRFFLRPWDVLGLIPHVDQRGFVCFADPEGLVLDRRRPVQVVEESLARVLTVLADGVSGRNRADFADEFEAYWRMLPNRVQATSLFDPGDAVCRLRIAVDQDTAVKRLYVVDGVEDIRAFYSGAEISKKITLYNALYLPLETGAVLLPPHPDGPFWTADTVRRTLVPAVSPDNRGRLRKLLKERPGRRAYLVVKLPRPSGGATLFGIRYDDVSGYHPLSERGRAAYLVPMELKRLEKSYLVGRGGGHRLLDGKRVLLIGCGAVGGQLAFELARAGVLDLTLVDHDTLVEENSFRHVLGRRYWGRNKAEALKAALEAELPYVRVQAINQRIEETVAARSVDISGYQLVVSALGNPTVELALNEWLHGRADGTAALFTWLESLGIGGHALLTRAGTSGCFECLYTAPDATPAGLVNRAAFAAPGQFFGRALSGCGSLHTPYGVGDAIRTANLAARLAVAALTDAEQGNPLLSWRGDAGDFHAAGFRLSPRFEVTEDELIRQRYAYASPRCVVCGTRAAA